MWLLRLPLSATCLSSCMKLCRTKKNFWQWTLISSSCNIRTSTESSLRLFSDGNSVSGETLKPSGENVAPSNHVVNKNRIPPGTYKHKAWDDATLLDYY